MSIDDEAFQSRPASEPRWVRYVLKPFPAPIFSFVAVTFAIFGFLFSYFVTRSAPSWGGWSAMFLFGTAAFLIGTAGIIRHFHGRNNCQAIHPRYAASQRRSTIPILILLVAVYSWILTLGVHIFDIFFAANRAGGMKYFITLGIAISASLYTRFHGRHVIKAHFGAAGGRNLSLAPGQAFVVGIFVISLGIYLSWLMI